MAEVAVRPVAAARAPAGPPGGTDLLARRAEIAATRARITVAVDALHDRVADEWPAMALAGAQRAAALPRVRRSAAIGGVLLVAGVAAAWWLRRRFGSSRVEPRARREARR